VRVQKLPYALIVGQKEQDENVVSVWNRKLGDKGSSKLADFIELITREINTKSLNPLES
jgi:threonyl-tRNA synthetase